MDSTGLRADHPLGVGHNCSAYRRDVFNRVGGYAHVSSGEDADIDMRMREHGKFVPFKNTAFGRDEDFFSIPLWIDALGVGYRLFLDHYTIHNEETVLYASV
jgi:hypothetical protein